MFLLNYLFGLRKKSILDEEKPFLHHLEDLRKTLVKVIITLILSMILCFNFAPDLLDFLRKPVDNVWDRFESKHLPSQVETKDWIIAKQIGSALPGLPEKAKKALLSREPEHIQQLTEAFLILKAMRTLPPEAQKEYIKEAVSSPQIVDIITELENNKALTQNGEIGTGGIKMMSALQPAESFNLTIKLAFYAGIVISFPLLMLFLMEFIIPGLKESERKTIYKSIAIGFGLFLTGASFAFFVVLPQILSFFFDYSMQMGIANDWRIGFYLSFALQFIFLFGLSFELPVVVMPFVKLGIINYEMMRSTRRYAIVIIAILSAVLTPQDVISMLMMGVPMYVLYEICIFMAKKHAQKLAREELAEKNRVKDEWENQSTVYQISQDNPQATVPKSLEPPIPLIPENTQADTAEAYSDIQDDTTSDTTAPSEKSTSTQDSSAEGASTEEASANTTDATDNDVENADPIYSPAPISQEDKDAFTDIPQDKKPQ